MNTEQFLEDLVIWDTQFEFTAIKEWKATQITKKEALNNKTSNIYFVSGVNNLLDLSTVKRVSDSDILSKHYFCIDIDLRSNMEWTEITNDDIKEQALQLIEEINTIEYFNEWSYVVFSWNWFHIYYIWKEEYFWIEEYSLWVSRIFKRFDELIWEPFTSDKMCKNISRILRLPWSINQKNGAEVEILLYQNKESRLISNIKSLARQEYKELREAEELRQKEIEEVLSKFKWDENKFYELINKQIPAYQIAQLLVPEFPFDWKKNFRNNKWWFTWYYYVKETNSIANWWSRYFNWWTVNSCWSNFELIKRSKSFTNKETFAFFRDLLKTNK